MSATKLIFYKEAKFYTQPRLESESLILSCATFLFIGSGITEFEICLVVLHSSSSG